MGTPPSQPGTVGQTSPILLRATGEQSAPRRLRDKGTRKESEPRGAEPSGGQGRAEPTRSYSVCVPGQGSWAGTDQSPGAPGGQASDLASSQVCHSDSYKKAILISEKSNLTARKCIRCNREGYVVTKGVIV